MPLIRKRITAGDITTIVGTALLSNGTVDDLTDATSVDFIMRRVGDDVPTVEAEAFVVQPEEDGKMQYTFVAGDTDIPGNYNIEFVVHFPSRSVTYPLAGVLRVDSDLDTVSNIDLTFASVADFRAMFPGEDATELDLWKAELIVSSNYHRSTVGYIGLSAADKLWLSRGTCAQAKYMQTQPALFSQMDITGYNTAGANATLGADGMFLGPVAKMFLSNLSWVGNISISTEPERYFGDLDRVAGSTWTGKWKPLRVRRYGGWR